MLVPSILAFGPPITPPTINATATSATAIPAPAGHEPTTPVSSYPAPAVPTVTALTAPQLPASAVVPTNDDSCGAEPCDPAHNSSVAERAGQPPLSAVAEQTMHTQHTHPAVAEDPMLTDPTHFHVADIDLPGPYPPPLVPLACGIAILPPPAVEQSTLWWLSQYAQSHLSHSSHVPQPPTGMRKSPLSRS